MRILIVEDQTEIAWQVSNRLAASGYAADVVGTLDDAIEAIRQFDYPLIVLDRRLPDGDGLTALPTIRQLRPGTRVLLVTAMRSIDERVNGLDSGADDYLTKPFDDSELMARIRAVLRRTTVAPEPDVVLGKLIFDFKRQSAFVSGRTLKLPKREALLLEALMRYAGCVVKHDTLISEIYGPNEGIQPDSLKMAISRLRQHLKDHDAGVEIHTLRGIGYLIEELRI
ncbi:MAG: response regulator transcription factor [Alphaproteobacteria bacterium]|nr:response regulator transcription factor [Alphaproteobacteria bacterium]